MEKNQSLSQQIFQVTGAILGWLGLAVQFYLIILNRTESVGETIIRFFSFFTILTNILVALCFTSCSLNKTSGFLAFFSRPATLAATAVNIAVVGLVYNGILRFLWDHTGLQWIIHELLHTIIPPLFVLYWLLFVPKTGLKWKMTLSWLIYPLLYLLLILILGALSGFYPYPFINVKTLGYPRALLNAALLTLLFGVLCLLLIALSKQLSKTKRPL